MLLTCLKNTRKISSTVHPHTQTTLMCFAVWGHEGSVPVGEHVHVPQREQRKAGDYQTVRHRPESHADAAILRSGFKVISSLFSSQLISLSHLCYSNNTVVYHSTKYSTAIILHPLALSSYHVVSLLLVTSCCLSNQDHGSVVIIWSNWCLEKWHRSHSAFPSACGGRRQASAQPNVRDQPARCQGRSEVARGIPAAGDHLWCSEWSIGDHNCSI